MDTTKLEVSRRAAMVAGVGAAATAGAGGVAIAQDAPLKVIDFHNHYIGPDFSITGDASTPAAQATNRNLASRDALLRSLEEAGVEARVINTPTAFLENADGEIPTGIIPRINDAMANLIAVNKGKLHGLATIDAFTGDEGARELTRAIKELGLRGVFVESARRDAILGDAITRPTLKVAEALGIPVFVHPLTDPQLHKRFSKTGPLGTRLARATINSAALCNLLEAGSFDDMPKLKVVVTTLALGGLMLAGGFGDGQRIRKDAPALTRRNVYIDTMGVHPTEVAAAIELLGVDHVIAGTDWPIAIEKDVPARLKKALDVAGVDAAGQGMVARGNVMKLLGLG